MPSAAADCQSSPGNSLGKYPPRWQRYGERGFDRVEERDAGDVRGFVKGEEEAERHKTDRPMRGRGCIIQSRAKSITHPPARRSTCSTRYVNHTAALSAIPSTQTVDDRQREFIVGDGPRHVVHVSE